MVSRRVVVGTSAFLVAVLLALLTVLPVLSADLRFTLDRNISHVYVNEDASVDIEYWLTYTAARDSSPIDIIDVGMPHDKYVLSSAVADLDGVPLQDIRKSEWIDQGVEVHLGSKTISPGSTGTLHLRMRVEDMVYQDSEDSSYASIRFSPHWYSSENVLGNTYMEVSFYLPPGMTADEPRYHDERFTTASIENDRVVYTWVREPARADRQYTFGASFPQRYVDRVAQEPVDVEGMIEAVLSIAAVVGFVAIFALVAVLGARASRRRRMEYLPPTLAVEGVEVRRGLTAPEAAILMELPLDKALTLISFGLVRKGALRVRSRKPLRFETLGPRPTGLHGYEEGFLAAVEPDGAPDERKLRQVVVDLVGSVNKKMKGFSRRHTVAYYRSIIDKAWERVQQGQADVSDEILGETIEWTSLDRDFERRAPETWVGRTYRRPMWWPHYHPAEARTSRSGGSSVSLPEVNLPTLPGSEFADGVVTGLQGFADGIVSNVESFTSGVTRVTNPPPASSSSGRRSSGGGCACACACAGCACACAGGGR